MKILWVKAGKLLPVDTGGKIRSYNLLRQLAARHETVLLSYYGGRRDEAYEAEIKQHLPGALTIYTAAPDATTLERSLHYVRCLPSPAPFAVTKFTSPKVQRVVAEWVGDRRFDVVVCDFLAASLNFPRVLATPSVLFQHNVESILWQRQAEHEPHPIKRLVFKLEAAKMLRYEQATVGRFDHIIAVSEPDRQRMSMMTDPARISVVPTGVDLGQYRAAATVDGADEALMESGRPAADEQRPLIVFLGSMDWEANIDGVDYFCREIFPQVRAAVPGARFRIVGRTPHARVLKLASDSIEVTGTVASVVEHLQAATVFVVPLRVGGGTRLKIYEAMAVGKAIVSTTIGAEGLDVHHGRDIWLADDAPSFASAVVTLLRDVPARRRLEKAAMELAAQYDWPIIARRFEETLARVANVTPEARQVAPAPAPVNI